MPNLTLFPPLSAFKASPLFLLSSIDVSPPQSKKNSPHKAGHDAPSLGDGPRGKESMECCKTCWGGGGWTPTRRRCLDHTPTPLVLIGPCWWLIGVLTRGRGPPLVTLAATALMQPLLPGQRLCGCRPKEVLPLKTDDSNSAHLFGSGTLVYVGPVLPKQPQNFESKTYIEYRIV